MNKDAFPTFLERIGHRVMRTASGCWYDASRFFLLAVPTHELRIPTAAERRTLLRRWPILGARFTAPLEAEGRLSYQIVCDERDYGLQNLSANTRSKVRRGLRRCCLAPLTPEQASTAGKRAHADTIRRQGRTGVLAGHHWEMFWAAAKQTPGMDIWGAWAGDKLAAFLVCMTFGETVEFLLARSRTDCLGQYPNNALLYWVTREMLVQRGVRQITFGLESLEPVGPLDEFKFSMGFRAAPLRQSVVFHPVLAAALRPRPVRAALQRWAGSSRGRTRSGGFWRKAVGLLRFAEEAGL